MVMFNGDKTEINKIYSVKMFVTSDKDPKICEYQPDFKSNELVFFIKGENNTTIGDTNLKDCPESMRFLPKGKIGGKYIVENISNPTVCIDIYFDATGVSNRVSYSYDNKKLNDKFLRLYEIWTKKKVGYYERSMAVFYEILAEIKSDQREYLNKKQRDYINKAYNYILDNFKSDKFDYKDLCSSTGLEYAYFSELFKKTYNVSPVRFVTKMKIDYAKELLVTNRYSITQIAEIVGFDDVSYFSKVFKKQTGFSPKNYPINIKTDK